jgi:CheY-like chemotaxis protein
MHGNDFCVFSSTLPDLPCSCPLTMIMTSRRRIATVSKMLQAEPTHTHMNKNGPVIIIEDDVDDRLLLKEVFQELNYPNEVCFFETGDKALAYLVDDSIYPFIILSDINLPKLNGFELRKMVHTNEGLSGKCIPYIFFSTSVDRKAVSDAYTLSVHGFFKKPDGFEQLKSLIAKIVDYWQECFSPNHFLQQPGGH